MTSTGKIVIAIDGHSSCGKSTLAKVLAKELGYRYIDSGAMYRAVALFMLNKKLMLEELNKMTDDQLEVFFNEIDISFHVGPDGSSQVYLNGENIEREIRDMMISDIVSSVSSIIPVRREMVRRQQQLGIDKGIVMDGRDIGTVVFPNAELKIFMTARTEIRAKRRYDELIGKGYKVSIEEVMKNIEMRDYQDTHRGEGPLVKAPDAHLLDNSDISLDQQYAIALNWVKETIQK